MAQNIPPASGITKNSPERVLLGKSTQTVKKRLQVELMKLMTSKVKGVSAFPDGDNLLKWVGTIEGPPDTAYEKLTYKLSLEFPTNYPYIAPDVKFVTPCYHPNVDLLSGTICLDILKEKWSALLDVQSILLSIQSLLGEPNNRSPLNPTAAKLWTNQTEFKKHLHSTFTVDGKTEKNGNPYAVPE